MEVFQRLNVPRRFAGDGAERDRAEKLHQIELGDQIDGALAEGFQIPTPDPIVHRGHGVAGESFDVLGGHDVVPLGEQLFVVHVHVLQDDGRDVVMAAGIVAAGVPARRGFIRLRELLPILEESDHVFFSDGIRVGPLAGILTGDLAAAQEIPGSLFADVAELVKLFHGQLVGDFAPVDVVHSNTPQNGFVGVRTGLCIAFCM